MSEILAKLEEALGLCRLIVSDEHEAEAREVCHNAIREIEAAITIIKTEPAFGWNRES